MPNVLLFDESTASHTPSSVSPCSSLQDVSVSFKNNATAPLVPADDGTVTLTRRADIFLATFSGNQHCNLNTFQTCLICDNIWRKLVLRVSNFLGSMQAVEILCSLSILYLFKDELQMDPGTQHLIEKKLVYSAASHSTNDATHHGGSITLDREVVLGFAS